MKDLLKGVDFDSESFTVKQNLIRNKYRVMNADGEVILKAKQKLFRMKEEFPFTDADDNPVFNIKASKVLDIAGDYAIVDEKTGEKVAILTKKFTLLKHVWHVKNPEGELQAVISSGSRFLELLRGLSDLLSFIPHSYTIEDSTGKNVGSIEGRLSLKDTYDVTVDREAPFREAVVVAAVTIDALEGN